MLLFEGSTVLLFRRGRQEHNDDRSDAFTNELARQGDQPLKLEMIFVGERVDKTIVLTPKP